MLVHPHLVPRRADPPQERDLRSCKRIPLLGMTARIGDSLVQVTDISEGGMNIDQGFPQGHSLNFTLYRRIGAKLELNHGVKGKGEVIWSGRGHSGLSFTPPTMALMRMIIRHAADLLGVEPQLLK